MKTKNRLIKGTFWGAALFYFIIAFEFFYMAGPFAAYFYSVYAPALRLFNDNPILSWLNSFFLPHVVRETSSALINAHEIIGAILALGGFIAFLIGACQVYYHKLTKRGVVTGGIYQVVRHPQYSSFMLCSFGLLILWPRYLVVIMFVTMTFAYYMLARLEERNCSEKFGQSYIDYMEKTNMFLPFRFSLLQRLPRPVTTAKKVLIIVTTYLLVLSLALNTAKGLQKWSIDSLYAVYTNSSVDLAVCKMSDEQINSIMEIVRADRKVASLLADYDKSTQYINYILPTEWYAAEVPMNNVTLGQGHRSPSDYDRKQFKIILTKGVTKGNTAIPTPKLLLHLDKREPIAEIWIDLKEQKVTGILNMPENIRYEGVPVAVY